MWYKVDKLSTCLVLWLLTLSPICHSSLPKKYILHIKITQTNVCKFSFSFIFFSVHQQQTAPFDFCTEQYQSFHGSMNHLVPLFLSLFAPEVKLLSCLHFFRCRCACNSWFAWPLCIRLVVLNAAICLSTAILIHSTFTLVDNAFFLGTHVDSGGGISIISVCRRTKYLAVSVLIWLTHYFIYNPYRVK